MPYVSRSLWRRGTSLPELSSGPWPRIASRTWGQATGALWPCPHPSVRACVPAPPPLGIATPELALHFPQPAPCCFLQASLGLVPPSRPVSAPRTRAQPAPTEPLPVPRPSSLVLFSLPEGHPRSQCPSCLPHRSSLSLYVRCLTPTARTPPQDSPGGSVITEHL